MADGGTVTFQPKSPGRGLMASDFITEHFGYLKPTDEEYERVKITYLSMVWKSEGYSSKAATKCSSIIYLSRMCNLKATQPKLPQSARV